ncbi:MAG: SdrD B-like domain-containing protein [Burkholderiales bacterium]
MPTITFKITSPFFNGNGSDYGAPSAIDVTVSGSTDPNIPNGQYDAWCLDPLAPIFIGDTYSADTYGSLDPAAYSPINLGALTSAQIDQLNWLIAQNFTADPKFGGAYNFGEVQAAIWEIVGYTNYNSIPGVPAYLSNNGTQVVDPNDIATLKSLAVTAIASGQALLPADTFFSAIIDPSGNVQPIIMQLHEGKLGDYVWEDLDGDGTQDANEAGVNGVVVRLLDGGGNLIAETVTGDDFSTVGVEHGFYQFTGLQAGNYQVQFIKPADFFAFTQANANANSVDAIDSDADTFGLSQVVTLGIDEINGTLDAGLVKKAEIGNRVWLDSDGDGNQDAGEAGVNGVTVNLLNGAGVVVATQQTSGDGNYLFSNLTPGTYSVQFVAPAGYLITTKDAASSTDANDSDADLVTGNTIQTVLESGESDLTWDAGLVQKARIGDYVWEDKDADGVQDAGETGIAGSRGVDRPSGNPTGITTTTNASGLYSFDVLPGTYGVKITAGGLRGESEGPGQRRHRQRHRRRDQQDGDGDGGFERTEPDAGRRGVPDGGDRQRYGWTTTGRTGRERLGSTA